MSSNKLNIITIIALIIITIYTTILANLQTGILILTFTSLYAIIVYYIQTIKKKTSLTSQFKILTAYIIGGTIALTLQTTIAYITEIIIILTTLVLINKHVPTIYTK
jgi:hypothetical protein